MMGGIPNSEINDLAIYWQAFPKLKDQLFVSNDTSYSELRSKDISHVIENSEDVKGYIERYEKRFEDFEEYLKERLICQMEEVQPVKEEIKIGNNIFARLADIPLVDKYHAYQVLDDEWIKIAIDFDIIGTEGKAAVKVVEPNLIMKKDKEVQEGWKGRILPFDLVQGVFLSDQLAEIKEKERRIEEIISEYEEMIEEMAEEDKESEILNEAQDAFQAKGVTARLKELKHPETEDEKKLKEMLEQYTKLSKEEKETKKEIKDLTAALHIKTKETIESLTDIQAEELLVEKWIRPLQEELMDIPKQVIGELIKQVQTLGDKYETTLIGIEKEIKEAEKSLVSMLDELCGNESDMKGIASLKALLGGE